MMCKLMKEQYPTPIWFGGEWLTRDGTEPSCLHKSNFANPIRKKYSKVMNQSEYLSIYTNEILAIQLEESIVGQSVNRYGFW